VSRHSCSVEDLPCNTLTRKGATPDVPMADLFTSSALRQRKLEVGNHDLRERGGRAALLNAEHLVHGAVMHVHHLVPRNGAWRQATH
jgi:hypothetical protein